MPIDAAGLAWTPGSFTKNFSWGKGNGLFALYEHIRAGFDNELKDVTRETYIERVSKISRPWQIATNFFLMNVVRSGVSYIVVDELVFQALTQEHSASFDRLAVSALNLSYAGKWVGQTADQRRPALWAHYYIKDILGKELGWSARRSNSERIVKFILDSGQYRGEHPGKIATNLNFIYEIAHVGELNSARVERWWVDTFFLALDRISDDLAIDQKLLTSSSAHRALQQSNFYELTGGTNLEKQLAAKHLVALYDACGGRNRLIDDNVRALQELRLPDVQWLLANDPRPQGALHPTNPRILKSIPRSCALLVKYLTDYDVIDADELATFDSDEFVRRRTRSALSNLKSRGVKPTMSAEELEKLTRDR